MSLQAPTERDLQEMLTGYIACALWSSTADSPSGSDQSFLDANFGSGDLAPETFSKMKQDCKDFAAANLELILEFKEAGNRDWSSVGHDLWLTRNGHGAGFWDRLSSSQGDSGTRLSKMCGYSTPFAPQDLYVGDDNKIYLM